MNDVTTTPTPNQEHYTIKLAHVDWSSETITELFAMWRLIRDTCARHGFPDWWKMEFEMDVTLSEVGTSDPERLKQAAKDLGFSVQITEEQL